MKGREITLEQAAKYRHSLAVGEFDRGGWYVKIPFTDITMFPNRKPTVFIERYPGNVYDKRLTYKFDNLRIEVETNGRLFIHVIATV